MVVGRVEEAAGRIGEVVEDRVGQPAGGDEPALVERRLVEREQAVGEVGVVLEDALAGRPAVLPRPTEAAVGPAEAGEDLVGRRRRGVRVNRGSPSAAPASANAAIARPFQAASALSSRAGCGAPGAARGAVARAPASRGLAARRRRAASTRRRIVRPSQLPSSVTSYAAANSGASSPRTSRISAAVQTNVAPSSPSVSASWLAANVAVVAAELAEEVVERARRRPRGSARRRSSCQAWR